MRDKVTAEKLNHFMQELAHRSRGPGCVYLAGGSSALLLGIREQTVDVDLKLDPEPAGAFEAISSLKNELNLNVELASPDDFIPAPPNWRSLGKLIATIGTVTYYHYDFNMQALAKIERGFSQDLDDVQAFMAKGLITQNSIQERFDQIKGMIVRYPALDAESFSNKIARFFKPEVC